jgi:hypothetical protein
MMKLVYAREEVEKSIFLAGPTPRDSDTPSWRPGAIKILHEHGFDGKVYVPELRPSLEHWSQPDFDYDEQIHWEWSALNVATIVVFWVPRELKKLPAFTTNVEFGSLVASGKCIFGAPPDAPKNAYLKALALRHRVEVFDNLEHLLTRAIVKCHQPY